MTTSSIPASRAPALPIDAYDRRFYGGMAVLIAVIVFVGFSPSFYLAPVFHRAAPLDEPRVDFHYPVFGNSLALIDSTLHLAIILEAAERGGIPRLAHVPWSQRPRAKRLPKHDLSVRGPQERCVHALGYHSRGNGVNELRTLARSRLGERARLLET